MEQDVTQKPVTQQSPLTTQSVNRHKIIYLMMLLLALIGLGDSLYLTVQHLTGQSVKCSVTSGCSAVLSSRYATMGGIPTAAFGVAAYFTVFSLATLALFGYRGAQTWLKPVTTVMALASLWFVYVQAFVLHAFCQFCLLSAGISLTLAVLALLTAAKK